MRKDTVVKGYRCERIPLRKFLLALALYFCCLEPNLTLVLILLSLLLRSLLVEHPLLVKYSKLTRCTFVGECPRLRASVGCGGATTLARLVIVGAIVPVKTLRAGLPIRLVKRIWWGN